MGETLTGGEALVRALCGHAVTRVFGIPGTHNLEIYRHLSSYGIRHVLTRHEQGAGYAADGYARVTEHPGVVITTTGPALLNAAAAIGQAYSDSVPLLVVSPGMPLRHPRLATGLLHEARSQTEALRGVAAFSHRVSSVAEIDAAVARAFTLFRTRRPRPAHIEIPLDLLEATEETGPVRLTPPAVPLAPVAAAVERAAEALRGARRPALVRSAAERAARPFRASPWQRHWALPSSRRPTARGSSPRPTRCPSACPSTAPRSRSGSRNATRCSPSVPNSPSPTCGRRRPPSTAR